MIHQLVQREMKRQGYTPNALAVASGLANPTIYAFLKGHSIGIPKVEALFTTLGITCVPSHSAFFRKETK